MKKNKIFKAFGVGALATLGLFAFTGCSLSDSDKADLMKGLDNANSFMQETIDQLKEQNRKLKEQNSGLKEQNDILKDYLEEIQNENAKITAEEAFKTYEIAVARYLTNYKGVRNNIRFTCTSEYYPNDSSVVEYFKTEDNGYVSILEDRWVEDEEFNGIFQMFYEEDGSTFEYSKWLSAQNSSYGKEELSINPDSEEYSRFRYALLQYFSEDVNAKDVKSVVVKENGCLEICFVFNEQEENSGIYLENEITTKFVTVEIDRDYKILSIEYNEIREGSWSYNDQEGNVVAQDEFFIQIEYNVIADDYINDLLAEAISKDLTE